MDDQTNLVVQPGEAERARESGAAALGRGGRMSRPRKSAAVLRLLRGEDLEALVGFRGDGGTSQGLSRDWGSCHDGCWRMRTVGGLEALPEAGAERAVVDGAADLEQPIGTAPRPAHLLRFVHATVDQEVGCSSVNAVPTRSPARCRSP